MEFHRDNVEGDTADAYRVPADRFTASNASTLTHSEQLKNTINKIPLNELSNSAPKEQSLCPIAVSLYGRLGGEALNLVCGCFFLCFLTDKTISSRTLSTMKDSLEFKMSQISKTILEEQNKQT
ncbi:hypothetical protein RCL1_003740 [Eukaryota sp. TZLM3-RCL]